MRVAYTYSHLNGLEYLMVHHPDLWKEVREVIESIDAESCRTKVSKEKRNPGKKLYSPVDMNEAFKDGFVSRGWETKRVDFYVTDDERLLRRVHTLQAKDQKREIKKAGREALLSYNQTDFVKNRIAVEVQFGKYSFVAHDLFVKHMSFYVSGTIDVGIEILPMKELEKEMSSGVPYLERDMLNVIRQGRGIPAVPLVLVGVAP